MQSRTILVEVLAYALTDVQPPPITDQTSTEDGKLRAVIDQYKLWEPGDTLNVCFFGGSKELRGFFLETARLWDEHISIVFDFDQVPAYRDCNRKHPSHIRVGFMNDGNWSYVGRGSVENPVDKPSLNIGEVADQAFSLVNKARLRGTILHELGHALALQHEHQSPESDCQNKILWEVVDSDLAKPPNNWDRSTVDWNLRSLADSPRLRTTAYDRMSIMHYSFPASWFKGRTKNSCWVVRNDSLSETDKAAIRSAYPASLQEQAEYIAQLDARTAQVTADMKLPEDQLKTIQDEINRILNKELTRNGIRSDFINVSTSGEGAPAIGSVDGDVNTTIDKSTSECKDVTVTTHGEGSPATGCVSGKSEVNVKIRK